MAGDEGPRAGRARERVPLRAHTGFSGDVSGRGPCSRAAFRLILPSLPAGGPPDEPPSTNVIALLSRELAVSAPRPADGASIGSWNRPPGARRWRALFRAKVQMRLAGYRASNRSRGLQPRH